MSYPASNWAYEAQCESPIEKLVLLILASYVGPDGSCFPSHKTMALRGCCSEKSVERCLRLFEERGWIERYQRRRADGYRTSDLIVFLGVKHDEAQPDSQSVRVEFKKSHPTVSPTSPDWESPPTTLEPVSEPVRLKTNKKPDRFDEFWKLYPRKVAKPAAHKSYTKALGKIDHEKLVGHLEQHIASGVWADAQYGPHATTWLNQERWTDELQSGGQGASVAGRQAPRGGGRENPSFAEIRARRNAGRSDGVEVSRGWSGVQGADHGWSDGAIDGEATIRMLKD